MEVPPVTCCAGQARLNDNITKELVDLRGKMIQMCSAIHGLCDRQRRFHESQLALRHITGLVAPTTPAPEPKAKAKAKAKEAKEAKAKTKSKVNVKAKA